MSLCTCSTREASTPESLRASYKHREVAPCHSPGGKKAGAPPLRRRHPRIQPAQVPWALGRPDGLAAPLQKRQQIGAAEAPLPPPADAEAGQPAGVGPAAQRHLADVQERRSLGDVEELGLLGHRAVPNHVPLQLLYATIVV